MIPILSGNVASALGGAYEVANSCRFDDGSSAYMHKTPGSAGDQQKFTFSFWIKRCGIATGTAMTIFDTQADDDNQFKIRFNDNGTLTVESKVSDHNDSLVTTQVFRDPSAWSNFVIAVDTTQGTAGNRVKIYHNGTQITAFGTENYPAEDLNTLVNAANKLYVGTSAQTDAYCDMYIAEFCLVDGSQLAATSFGEFDEDSPTIWKPKDVSGLSFGTNGFYLDFEDSSNLGNDANGGTDLTEVNLAATDLCSDSPTNNFCVLNPLDNYYQGATFSEGNCKLVTAGSSNTAPTLGTFGLTAGKWYWEVKFVSDSQGSSYGVIGIEGAQVTSALDALLEGTQSYGLYLNDGKIWTNNSANNHGAHIDLNAIIGVALDLDNNRIYFSKDGNWGDGSGNWDESTPNNYLSITDPASVALGAYFPAHGDWSSGTIGWEVNFGNPVHSISSGNADANGYGNFEFSVPSGYLSLCSKNLGSDGG